MVKPLSYTYVIASWGLIKINQNSKKHKFVIFNIENNNSYVPEK